MAGQLETMYNSLAAFYYYYFFLNYLMTAQFQFRQIMRLLSLCLDHSYSKEGGLLYSMNRTPISSGDKGFSGREGNRSCSELF